MSLTLAQLRLVIDVAETSSFKEAARLANLTQPAVSRSIKQAEMTLGTRLFQRTTRQVLLTNDGQEFLQVAKRIVTEFDAGMGRFDAYRVGQRGTLTIAALPSLAAGALAPAIAEYARMRPQLELSITTGNSSHLLDAIRSGNADLAVTDDPGDATGLQVHRLFEDEMIILVSSRHEFAVREHVTWRDLTDTAFVLLGEGTSVRGLTDKGFAISDALPTRVIRADSIPSAAALVSQGLGVTAVPRSVLSLIVNGGALSVRPLLQPVISRTIAITAPTEPRRSPAAESFTKLLTDYFRERQVPPILASSARGNEFGAFRP